MTESKYRRLGSGGKLGDYIARYVVYPATLLGCRGDVFHVLDHAYGHLLGCVPSRRSVATCHDLMLLKLHKGELPSDARIRWMPLWMWRASVACLKRAARIIADSMATADDLVKHLRIDATRIRVVRPGLNSRFTLPSDPNTKQKMRDRLGLGGGPILLHVGKNWFYKNIDGLLYAFSQFRRSRIGRDAVLVKVGDRLSAEQRALVARLHLDGHVRQLGLLSQDDLQAAYWAADVLVHPSFWEGFGWPPLEAMASGTPVIASTRGALAEVVGTAAEVIDPDDCQDIAVAMERVLSEKGLRGDLVGRGLDRAQLFTWDGAGRELLEVYREVVNKA
jgi:glycosyltransferase involved in cell wall biosynthesis